MEANLGTYPSLLPCFVIVYCIVYILLLYKILLYEAIHGETEV